MTTPTRSFPGASRLETLCCSFCNKDKAEVEKLVAGPGIYICNECIVACNRLLAGEAATDLRAWDELPDEEMLASISKIQAMLAQVDAAVHDYVSKMRERNISWTRIGQALGVSKQAAWERFSGEE